MTRDSGSGHAAANDGGEGMLGDVGGFVAGGGRIIRREMAVSIATSWSGFTLRGT